MPSYEFQELSLHSWLQFGQLLLLCWRYGPQVYHARDKNLINIVECFERNSVQIFGLSGLNGGLTNQRLSLVGLVMIARQRKGLARFPSQMVDFAPRSVNPNPVRFLFRELFDVDVLRKATADEPLTGNLPTNLISFAEAFDRGYQECFRAGADGRAATILTGLQASRHLRGIVTKIVEWLNKTPILALQLRIERDWQEYVGRLLVEGRRGQDDIILDPRRIFQKIRSNSLLDGFERIWACCDEGDLLLTPKDLKRIAANFNFELIFKSDIPSVIELPDVLLMRTMVDYSICQHAEAYVGLTRSTFSRSIYKSSEWTGSPRLAFDYNSLPDRLHAHSF